MGFQSLMGLWGLKVHI